MKVLVNLFLFAILLLAFIFVACDKDAYNGKQDGIGMHVPETAEVLGNLPGSRGKVVASDSGAFYYTDPVKGIMKITEDGTLTVLTFDKATKINLLNEWIYYEEVGSRKICRINTFGKEKAVLMELEPSENDFRVCLLTNDWIYYRSNEGIARANIVDMSIEQVVAGEDVQFLGAKDEWLYLLKSSKTFYKTYLDGTNETPIFECEGDVWQASYDGEWIYFTTCTRGFADDKLFKMRIDGSNLSEYGQLPYQSDSALTWSQMDIYSYDGSVYYKSGAQMEGDRFRRINSEFTDSEAFIEGGNIEICFAGDWVFFSDAKPFEAKVYMMRLDKREMIELYSYNANIADTDVQAEKNRYEAGVENDAPERSEVLGNPNVSLSNGIGSGAYWVAAYNGEFYYAALGRGIAKINEKGEETLLTTDYYTWVNVADG